jgi:hypothetical protein
MLFVVVERFKPGKAPDIYRRFREHGRMAPDDVKYIASWVDLKFERCFQVMESENESRLRVWTERWDDLTEFEIIPVQTSAEAAAAMASQL